MSTATVREKGDNFKTSFIAFSNNFQMLDFLKRGYNNMREMVAQRDKLLDIQNTVKLAADDGVVTYEEIRESLRK